MAWGNIILFAKKLLDMRWDNKFAVEKLVFLLSEENMWNGLILFGMHMLFVLMNICIGI